MWIAAGHIHQGAVFDFVYELWVVCIFSCVNRQEMWFDIEDFSLGFTKIFPVLESVFGFLSGGGWYLNIDRCFVVFDAIFNK